MNTGDSLVSLIVPVYNVGNYLNVCVDSLLRQTYANIQVILVDDGSTDGSADLCDAWADKDSRVMVIHQANNGVSMARNAGINAAEGDWPTTGLRRASFPEGMCWIAFLRIQG